MRAARAGPVLRGQRFANEQILRGPGLFAGEALEWRPSCEQALAWEA